VVVTDGPRPVGIARSVRDTMEMIRFSHSVFALPFALLALFVSAEGWPPLRTLAWVLVAMVAARSMAMAVNRLADRRFDAENPRTANRHLVTGALSPRFALLFATACGAVFLVAAGQLNGTALALAPLVLLVLVGYSWLKRATPLSHLGVGLALGLSPLGAWVAGAGGLEGDLRIPLVLGAAVTAWVAGFDVIYACQDAEVDRRLGLHSIPARLGVRRALSVAALLHVACAAAFALAGLLAGLGPLYHAAVGVAVLLLVVEHAIVSEANLARVNVAFFNLNGLIALLLGGAGIADVLA
jgi:4-hydroxybenzoate polyprenyltransferase